MYFISLNVNISWACVQQRPYFMGHGKVKSAEGEQVWRWVVIRRSSEWLLSPVSNSSYWWRDGYKRPARDLFPHKLIFLCFLPDVQGECLSGLFLRTLILSTNKDSDFLATLTSLSFLFDLFTLVPETCQSLASLHQTQHQELMDLRINQEDRFCLLVQVQEED